MNALHWMMLAVVVALVSALIGLAWAAWDMRNVDLTSRKEQRFLLGAHPRSLPGLRVGRFLHQGADMSWPKKASNEPIRPQLQAAD